METFDVCGVREDLWLDHEDVGHGICIRLVDNSSRDPLHALANDPHVSRSSSVPNPCPIQLIDEWIASNQKSNTEELSFAVWKDQRVMGVSKLRKIDYFLREAELSYWIGSMYWGLGLGLEAAKCTMNYAFQHMGMRCLHAHCLRHSNPASRKILERLGFVPDSGKIDLPVEKRFAKFYPGDSWMFFRLPRDPFLIFA